MTMARMIDCPYFQDGRRGGIISRWKKPRLHQASASGNEVSYRRALTGLVDAPFDVEVFVSGFASRYNGPGFNTRASRAFLKLARGAFPVS